MNILIVDDDSGTRTLLTIMLRRHDYALFVAEGGEEALQVMAQHPVDLIITDLMMPGMDGYAFIEAVRHDYDRDTLPILVLSAVTSVEEMRTALTLGANRALSKPISAAHLEGLIQEMLNPPTG
jgi:DNA-binding response OmpR family regulator